jgi:endonuclease/exonuclease/phosphatase family metal-dependent hydrolase
VTLFRNIALAIAGQALTSALVLSPAAADTGMTSRRVPPAEHGLTVLSYNVEGLPWPIASARQDAAVAIGQSLRELRNRHDAPQIVAVQEAFGAAQKRIGRDAGYRYAAFGPARAQAGAGPATAADRLFWNAATVWHGEGGLRVEDSGLAVFSDFPIVWARRVAFPDYACAGWDCLANKGMLAVAVRLPGQAQPVILVDTHLNSNAASGTSTSRSFYAYRRQVDALGAFAAALRETGDPVILAGDFNVGRDDSRSSYLARALLARDAFGIAAAEDVCGGACRMLAPQKQPTTSRSKTLLAYTMGPRASLVPEGLTASFGFGPGGRHLSDHIGVERSFAVRS